MIDLEVFGEPAALAAVAARLDALPGVSHVRLADLRRPGQGMLCADVHHDAADQVLLELAGLGVPDDDITLTRVELIGRPASRGREATLIWADVLGLAGSNAALLGRYLAFMAVAGVIACYGVVDRNAILIVGAMAVSPDLLPITSISVAIVGREPRLAARAFLTLTVGLAVASLLAAIFAFAQDQLELLPPGFGVGDTVLRSLSTVNDETIAVAFAAGVAGMLALETRASSGVGVAISVTTIPAAAYLGVAAGLGEASAALGALGVLGMNVAMLVLGGALTLGVQRVVARRRERARAAADRRADARGPSAAG